MSTSLRRLIAARTDDRGSYTLWAVIIFFALLLCLGLVVDGGGKLTASQQAQLVAEEAARAAGQQVITPPASRGIGAYTNPLTAQAAAQKYLAQAGVQGVVTPTGPGSLAIVTTVTYQPKVLGLIGIGPQTVTGSAGVTLNRTNNIGGALPGVGTLGEILGR